MKHSGTIEIQTSRLLLRKMRIYDALDIYQCCNDPIVKQYIGYIPCDTFIKTQKFVHMNINQYQNNTFYNWIIEKDGYNIGLIGAFDIDEICSSAELAYYLKPDYWNQGIMSEACQAIIDYLLNQVGFYKLKASFFKDNIASKKVLIKCGMSYEKTLNDVIYYSIYKR